MASSVMELGNRLEEGVGRLIEALGELRTQNVRQAAEIARLRAELEISHEETRAARRELESCKAGMALRSAEASTGGNGADEAQRYISQLVRGIDECIALLKQ